MTEVSFFNQCQSLKRVLSGKYPILSYVTITQSFHTTVEKNPQVQVYILKVT